MLTFNSAANGVHFFAYDGNGNAAGLVKATDGTMSAIYEYEPFGQPLRATGAMAKENPFRLSTKRANDTADLVLYEYRASSQTLGRWLSRDPAEEGGGRNLYGMVFNNPPNATDTLGLWATSVHHQIVKDWLTDPIYRDYQWHCCKFDVVALIMAGSDEVDGVGPMGNWPHWCEAQSSAASFEHAMRNGATGQSVQEAKALYNKFLAHNLVQALTYKLRAEETGRCWFIEQAFTWLGRAYHAYSDSLSPAHEGFQPWWGPIDGIWQFGAFDYWAFVRSHEAMETYEIYDEDSDQIVELVDKKFKPFLRELLK